MISELYAIYNLGEKQENLSIIPALKGNYVFTLLNRIYYNNHSIYKCESLCVCVLNRLRSWRCYHDMMHIFEKLMTSGRFWVQFWGGRFTPEGGRRERVKLLTTGVLKYHLHLVQNIALAFHMNGTKIDAQSPSPSLFPFFLALFLIFFFLLYPDSTMHIVSMAV